MCLGQQKGQNIASLGRLLQHPKDPGEPVPPREAFDTVCRLCANSGKSPGNDSSDSATSSSTSDQDQWKLDPLVVRQKKSSEHTGQVYLVVHKWTAQSITECQVTFLFSSSEYLLVLLVRWLWSLGWRGRFRSCPLFCGFLGFVRLAGRSLLGSGSGWCGLLSWCWCAVPSTEGVSHRPSGGF